MESIFSLFLPHTHELILNLQYEILHFGSCLLPYRGQRSKTKKILTNWDKNGI